MKLAYVILFMMAVTAVFGRTLTKRDNNEGEKKDGEKKDDEKKDGEKKDDEHRSDAPKGCSCFTDDGPGGDDSGDDDDHKENGHDDGNGGRSDGHSTRCGLSRYHRAPSGPGHYRSYCRNDNGDGNGNVRSCVGSHSRCHTDCCRYCCFNDPRTGGD